MFVDNTVYFDRHNVTDGCIVHVVGDDAVVYSPVSAEVADNGLTARPMSAADRTGDGVGENHNSLVRAESVV